MHCRGEIGQMNKQIPFPSEPFSKRGFEVLGRTDGNLKKRALWCGIFFSCYHLVRTAASRLHLHHVGIRYAAQAALGCIATHHQPAANHHRPTEQSAGCRAGTRAPGQAARRASSPCPQATRRTGAHQLSRRPFRLLCIRNLDSTRVKRSVWCRHRVSWLGKCRRECGTATQEPGRNQAHPRRRAEESACACRRARGSGKAAAGAG